MAKINGFFGSGISGKVGQVVYYRYRGKDCMRSLPAKRADGGTPAQLLNQHRFLMMTRFCNQFKYVLIPQIWNLAAKKMTGRHLFMKTNKVAFDPQGNIPDLRVLKLSVGKLLLPSLIQVQRHEEGSSLIDVSWLENYYNGGITFWDELLVVSAGGDLFSTIKYTGIRRGDLKGSFELPELKAPATHLYLFFSSLERTNYSESVCVELDGGV